MGKEKKIALVILCGSFLFSSLFLFITTQKVINQKKEEKKERHIILKAVDVIAKEGTDLGRKELEEVILAIYRISKKMEIDYRIILALARVESNFRNSAVSPKGARGLLQIKPSVAYKVAEDAGIKLSDKKGLHDSVKNVTIGAHLLSSLVEEYYDIHGALSAYNMGKKRLIESIKNDYRTDFSHAVLKQYKRYIEILPDP